jgi:hypothetical protein
MSEATKDTVIAIVVAFTVLANTGALGWIAERVADYFAKDNA